MKKTLIASILSTLFLTACVGNKQDNSAVLTDSGLNPQNFVTDINGKKTGLFVLKNKNNMEVCVTNFGGRIYNPQIEMFAHFKTKSSFHKTKRII